MPTSWTLCRIRRTHLDTRMGTSFRGKNGMGRGNPSGIGNKRGCVSQDKDFGNDATVNVGVSVSVSIFVRGSGWAQTWKGATIAS